MNSKAPAIVCFGSMLLCLAAACSKMPSEEAIMANIKSMQEAAENKQPRKAVEYLADHFSGNYGIDKTGLRQIMAGLFLRHTNVHIAITRMDIKINPQDPLTASTNGVVILTGGENILPQDGRVYRVSGDWQSINGEWLLVRAKWE